MKTLYTGLLLTIAGVSACSTASNNANIRGTNTNTGYVTNSNTNTKPVVPANATNVEPPSMGNSTPARSNSNTNVNANANANVKKPVNK